jgi:benzoyl-CoA reductase subunit C
VPTELAYYIFMPANIESPRALPLLTKEYVDFKKALEQLGGKTISDDDLDEAIELHNVNRRLMKEIWEFRKQDIPAITGAEAMGIVLAGQVMDVAEHNRLLEELLKQLPDRKINRDTGIRLMLTGGENDDTSFVRFVEEQLGATVVIGEHCAETRYFWDEVVPNKDRLAAIARRYIERWPCPTTDWKERRRMVRILQFAKDYKVEAVILYQQKFCDPHEFANPILQEKFQEIGIPCLRLEFDVIVPVGQLRTRIEAFFEQITLQII